MTTNSLMAKAVDSLFNRLGQVGIHKGREIRFLLIAPDEVVGIEFARAHTPTLQARFRVLEIPDLSVGDRIETEDAAYLVHSEPVKDIHNLVWTADLICV